LEIADLLKDQDEIAVTISFDSNTGSTFIDSYSPVLSPSTSPAHVYLSACSPPDALFHPIYNVVTSPSNSSNSSSNFSSKSSTSRSSPSSTKLSDLLHLSDVF
jgi:hypothetical protein